MKNNCNHLTTRNTKCKNIKNCHMCKKCGLHCKCCQIINRDGKQCKNLRYKNSKCCKFHLTMLNKCKNYLSGKIAINMKEREKRGWGNKQAIAIAYSEVKKNQPICRTFFTR